MTDDKVHDLQVENSSTELDVDPSAIGGNLHDLPPNYYRSPRFLGTVAAAICIAINVYLELAVPVSHHHIRMGNLALDLTERELVEYSKHHQ